MESRELPVVVALTALSCTLVLAFGRVFEAGSFVAPLVAAAVLPHLIGALTRWRRAGDLVAWGANGLGLAVFVLFVGPGTGSPAAVADRLSGGWNVITGDVVPIRATPGAVLLAVLVVWIAAAVADDLAFRRQASLGALAPGLMVLIWIAALGTDHGQWLVVAAFGGAGTLFLALQHQVLLDQRRTLITPGGLIHAPRLLLAGALVGALAVAAGVAAAPALPGGDKPLFQTDGLGRDHSSDSYRTTVPPLLDIGAKLNRGDEELLFTVRADRADYWRIVALDDYQSVGGGQWTLTAEGDAVADELEDKDAASPLTQRYTIAALDERWMPAAYEPVSVSRDDILVVRSSSTLVTLRESVLFLRYTVVSDAAAPDVGPDRAASSTDPVPSALQRFTQLPGDFPASVIAEAERVTAGLTTPLDRARALRDYFRAPGAFTYDPTVQLGDDENAIAQFLFDRRGFCVQFASAYATMARAVGIPARVAVGFTPGELQDGEYQVTNFEAHAWPEIWLGDSIGWTHAFDPTPPSEAPGGSNLPGEPDPAASSTTPSTSVTPDTTPATTPDTTPATTPGTAPDGGVTIDPTPTAAEETGSNAPWLLAVVLAVVVLLLTPLVLVMALKSHRRSRRRGHSDPAAAIAGAWAEAIDDLTDRKLTWPASTTPLEVARQAPRVAGNATATPLRALADAYGSVRYGDEQPSIDAADDAWDHVDTLHRALNASGGALKRLRARLDPTTLRRAKVGAATQRDPAGWSKPRSPSTND